MARQSKGITLPIIYKADLKGIKDSEGALKNFGKLAAGVGVAAIGAVTGIATAGVRAFADFDAALQQSVAIMGNVSDTLRTEMSDAAREVAKTTTFSAEEAAESYFFLASAGLDAEQSIAALPKVAAFAQAGMFDMATATDLLTDAQSALGLTSEDTAENLANMSNLGDVLVKANTLANASVSQFSEALTNKAAASMRSLNIATEEGVAVLAVFADQGIKGSQAGTTFNATIRGLTNGVQRNASEFQRLGVEVFNSEGEMNNMADIVADLEGALSGMSVEQQRAQLTALGFTEETLAGTLALLGNSEAIREYESELRNAGGTVDEVAGKQLETFSAQLDLLKSQFADVGIEVGSTLVPILLELMQELAPVLGTIGDAVADAFVALAPVIQDLAGQLPSLVNAFVPLIPVIGQIVAVLIELINMALPFVVTLFDQLLPIITELAPIIAEVFIMALQALLPVFMQLIDALMPIVEALLPVILDLIIALAPVIVSLIEAFMPLIELILPLLVEFLNILTPILTWVAELVGAVLVGAVNFLVEAIAGITEKLFEFGVFFEELWRNIANFFIGIINSLIGAFEGFINFVIDGINSLINAINRISFEVPDWVPEIGGRSVGFNIPKAPNVSLGRIPELAEGGIVDRRTLAVIGEAGPEAVVPLDKLGAMGGGNYYITVNAGMGTNGADVGREIVAAIRRYERTSGRVFASA